MEETGRLDSPVWTCCCVVVTEKETGVWSASATPVTTHTQRCCVPGTGGASAA